MEGGLGINPQLVAGRTLGCDHVLRIHGHIFGREHQQLAGALLAMARARHHVGAAASRQLPCSQIRSFRRIRHPLPARSARRQRWTHGLELAARRGRLVHRRRIFGTGRISSILCSIAHGFVVGFGPRLYGRPCCNAGRLSRPSLSA